MRKGIKKVLVLFAVLAVFVSASALACEITFDPPEVKVDKDGKATVRAIVRWEHRRCVLEDDDINIDYNNVKLIKESGWRKIKRGLFENTLEIQLTGKEGSIRVWRECSKKGISEGIIKIKR